MLSGEGDEMLEDDELVLRGAQPRHEDVLPLTAELRPQRRWALVEQVVERPAAVRGIRLVH